MSTANLAAAIRDRLNSISAAATTAAEALDGNALDLPEGALAGTLAELVSLDGRAEALGALREQMSLQVWDAILLVSRRPSMMSRSPLFGSSSGSDMKFSKPRYSTSLVPPMQTILPVRWGLIGVPA
jgi:hypothetical protein